MVLIAQRMFSLIITVLQRIMNAKIVLSALSLAISLSLVSCGGEKATDNEATIEAEVEQYGFTPNESGGKIYVNASDYASWQYIDIIGKHIASAAVGEKSPEKWQFAIHRFDVKTNSGKVLETSVTDFSGINEETSRGEYVPDVVSDKIATDMSGMRSGNVKYAEDGYNAVLSRWMDMDMTNMPPSFTLSGRVYVLQTVDGAKIALKFTGFRNIDNQLGFVTIEYRLL